MPDGRGSLESESVDDRSRTDGYEQMNGPDDEDEDVQEDEGDDSEGDQDPEHPSAPTH